MHVHVYTSTRILLYEKYPQTNNLLNAFYEWYANNETMKHV